MERPFNQHTPCNGIVSAIEKSGHVRNVDPCRRGGNSGFFATIPCSNRSFVGGGHMPKIVKRVLAVVSSNVTASAENVDTGFAYSDHNPVKLTFTLQ